MIIDAYFTIKPEDFFEPPSPRLVRGERFLVKADIPVLDSLIAARTALELNNNKYIYDAWAINKVYERNMKIYFDSQESAHVVASFGMAAMPQPVQFWINDVKQEYNLAVDALLISIPDFALVKSQSDIEKRYLVEFSATKAAIEQLDKRNVNIDWSNHFLA